MTGHLTAPGQAVLNITSLSAGGSYDASDRLSAGYGMVEFFVTPSLRERLRACSVHPEPRFSDHAPFVVDYAE